MSLAETSVLAVELKLNGVTAFTSGISTAEAATGNLNKAVGGMTSKAGYATQAIKGTASAIEGMGSHLKNVITGPLGVIGLGAGLFTLAGAFKESIGYAQTLGLATEKLTALTGENAATVSTQVAVFQKYGLSVDQASTLIGFAEKTLGKLNETTAKSAPATKSATLAHLELVKAEEQAAGKSTKHTDALIKEQKALDQIAAAHAPVVAGLTKLQAFQKQYGITLTTSTGAAVDFETELRNVSDFYISGAAASTKAYVASQLFGRGYAALIPILRLGSAGIKDAEQAAKDLGLTLTDQNASDLREYQKNIRETGDAVSGLQLQLGLALIPTVGELAKSLTKFLAGGGTQQIVSGFKSIVQEAKDLGTVVTGTIIPTLQGLATTAKGFWESIPAPIRDILVKGFIADRTIHFLFGVSPINLGKSLLGDIAGPLFGQFAARGSSPANPVFVSGGGIGGDVLGKAAGGIGLTSLASFVALAAVPLIPLVATYFLAGGAEGIAAKDLAGRQATAAARGLNPNGVPSITTNGMQSPIAAWAAAKAAGILGPNVSGSPDDRQAAEDARNATILNTAAAHDLETSLRSNTAALRASNADIYSASAKARGFTFNPNAAPSTSLAARFKFLAGNESGSKDAAVAVALATHFESGSSPLYQSSKNIVATIKALKADQHQLLEHGDTKNAGIVKSAIGRLQTVLKNKDFSPTIVVKNATYFDGRLVQSNLERYLKTGGAHGSA